MTEDQRTVVVGLMANALRTEIRLRAEAETAGGTGSLLATSAARARHAAAARYVQGMVDVVAVLFAGGRPTAEACLEHARSLAGGPSTRSDD
jgi:hypothetical protein